MARMPRATITGTSETVGPSVHGGVIDSKFWLLCAITWNKLNCEKTKLAHYGASYTSHDRAKP